MRKGNLLIVDDEEDIIDIIQDILGKFSANVYTANNGKEAVNVLNTFTVHLVICDINMPEMNGVEFIKKIRGEGNKVPIIFYTGFGSRDLMVEAAKFGAFDFIEKPLFYQLEEIAARGMQYGLKQEDPNMPVHKLPHNEITKYQQMLMQLAKQKKKA